VSLVGTWVQRVAVGWYTWELTHSGTWLGIIALADLAPAVVAGPLGGGFADRHSPLRINLVCQTLAMLSAIALALCTAAGVMTAALLAALVLGHGTVMGFAQPARLALVYSLVDREHLPSAIAFNSVAFNLARFIGPAVAGVALVASGPALAFGLNAVSFIAFLFVLTRIRIEIERPGPRRAGSSLLTEIRDGAAYAVRHREIGPLLLFAATLSLFGRSFVELLPGFADGVLSGGAATLAMLSSAMGVGAVTSGLWLANARRPSSPMRFVAVCALVTALATIAFAASTSLVFSVLAVTVAGAFMSMAGVSIQTFLQLAVDAEYRARLMSLYGVIFRSGPALGALIMGVASDLVGLQWPVAVGASIAALASVRLWVLTRDRAPG
jgi:predicted MFS family arabinose efflux permease